MEALYFTLFLILFIAVCAILGQIIDRIKPFEPPPDELWAVINIKDYIEEKQEIEEQDSAA